MDSVFGKTEMKNMKIMKIIKLLKLNCLNNQNLNDSLNMLEYFKTYLNNKAI